MTHAIIRPLPVSRPLPTAGHGLLLVLLVLGASCRGRADATPQPTPPPTVAPATPTAEAATPGAPAPQRPAGVLGLTLWVPPAMSPQAEGEAGAAFDLLLKRFQESHPQVTLNVLTKKPYDQGGLLDLLTATSPVAPDALPDLAALDMIELVTLYQADIIRPLNNLVATDVSRTLAPVGREAATYQGQLLGLPLQLDLQQLLYHPSLEGQVPRTWASLVNGQAGLLFPAGDDARAVTFVLLQHYASRGGRVVEEGGRIILDRNKLVQTLQMFAQGRASGVFPTAVLDLGGFQETLEAYSAPASPPLAQVTASAFLANRERFPDTAYAPVPTTTGTTFSLVKGWALALLTRSPQRQAQSVELMQWLTSSANAAQWSRAARVLPANQTTLRGLAREDGYYDFAGRLLEQGAPYPAVSDQLLLVETLQQALQDVLLARATPEQAASEALATLAGGAS